MSYMTITHDDSYYGCPINTGITGQFGCYEDILASIKKVMDYMLSKYSKVLFVRFDVSFPAGYPFAQNGTELSHFIKIMRENGKNSGIELGYVWCREQESSDNPHFHFIALLNGHKVQAYRSFLFAVERAWSVVLNQEARGLVHWCDGNGCENGIMLRKPTKYAIGEELIQQEAVFIHDYNRCFEWASYLAKVNQKEGFLPGVRKYGSSQCRY